MATFEEFGKAEYVQISTRRNTFFLYQDDKGKIKRKNFKTNSTLEVQTNYVEDSMAWVHISNYGWCKVPTKDWKITKIVYPRYHAHCLEYRVELEKWLNQKPSRIRDEDFKYTSLREDGCLD